MKPKLEKRKEIKVLSRLKLRKFDSILRVKGGINKKIREGKLTAKDKVELKSHAIVKAIQIKKYVRN